MLPTTLIEPDGAADGAPGSGTRGLGAESGRNSHEAPLQSQSCYVSACSPVHVRLITTSAFKQLSLSVEENPVLLRCVTTFRTSLRSLCSGNFNDINAMLPCHRLNSLLELVEGNSMYLSVGFLRLFPSPFLFLRFLSFSIAIIASYFIAISTISCATCHILVLTKFLSSCLILRKARRALRHLYPHNF